MTREKFESQLKKLDNKLLKMAILVEESVNKAVYALKNQDPETAREVIRDDAKINDMEIDITEKCSIILATENPVAGDLRHVISIMKIITDLERAGDHSVHIAKNAIKLAGEAYIKPLIDLPEMSVKAADIIHTGIESFINRDPDAAYQAALKDREIDDMHLQVVRELIFIMLTDNKKIDQALSLMFTSRFIERLGDHAKNICEWAIYSVKGEKIDL